MGNDLSCPKVGEKGYLGTGLCGNLISKARKISWKENFEKLGDFFKYFSTHRWEGEKSNFSGLAKRFGEKKGAFFPRFPLRIAGIFPGWP